MNNINNNHQQSSIGLMPGYCPYILNHAISRLLGDVSDREYRKYELI